MAVELRTAAVSPQGGQGAVISRQLDEAIRHAIEDVGPDEVAPTESAQQACRRHLAAVADDWPAGSRFPLPRVSGSGDGDLLCQWRKGDRKALVVFMRDGEVRAFTARVEEGSTVDTRATSDPSPAETLDALDWLAAG
jgi:hypothetical protein